MKAKKVLQLESNLYSEAIALLKELISIPSFSREEHHTAGAISKFIGIKGIEHIRIGNNVFAGNGISALSDVVGEP